MLRSLTGSPPAWHAEKFKADCQFAPLPEKQAGKLPASLGGINVLHQPTGEAYAKFLAALAGYLKQEWPTQIDAIFVEGAQAEIEAAPDESPAMNAYWQKWSGTNAAWRTPESLMAGDNPDQPAAVKAEACREAWLLNYVAAVTTGIRRGWPGLPVQTMTTNDDFHRLHASAQGRSRNVCALAQLATNPCTGTSSSGSFEMLRSFAGGKWLWSWTIHTGSGATPGADLAQAPFHDVSRVAAGWLAGNMLRITYPGTWYRYPDRQVGDFGVRSYFLSARRTQEFAPVVLNTALAPAPVAILWSQHTRRIDRSRELFMSAIAWGHLLKRIQVDFDYLPDDAGGFDLNFAERLKPYKLLILPNTQAMASGTCDAIREWVNAGGSLLGFGAPGIYDEAGARRQAIPLADVFGADVARMRMPGLIRPDKLETTHPEGAYIPYPPVDYKFRTNLTAALKPAGGTPRAWFVGEPEEPAIVENAFGQGKTLLSGFPIGHEYWQAHPYEVSFGLTYFRLTDVYEFSRYEAWVLKELEKRGVVRSVTLPVARFLRAQSNDDPDWSHTYRNGPEYAEYVYEEERPVRSIIAFCRRRDGIDNTYVGISHTEGNYSYGRGYFRCTLSGAAVVASVAMAPVAGQTPVVVDARFGVPVPSAVNRGRVEFGTWLPLAQSAAFAVAPAGNVRLFGPGNPTGITPEELAKAAAGHAADGKKLAEVEMLDRDRITEFLRARKDKTIVISYGDTRFRAAAEQLADKLRRRYQIESRLTCEGPRGQCSKSYMLGFGYFRPDPAPVRPDVLLGNCQDNGLMWRFIMRDSNVEMGWLPVEVNQNFPGYGRSIVMLSCPISTNLDGSPRKDAPVGQQLVIGASGVAEAVKGVEAVR